MTPLLDFNYLLAQAGGNLDSVLSTAAGIIAKVAYLIALAMFFYGCWQARRDLGEAITPIGVAALFGIGGVILDALFQTGGLPTIQIGR